jgi:hypothetical protein
MRRHFGTRARAISERHARPQKTAVTRLVHDAGAVEHELTADERRADADPHLAAVERAPLRRR